MPSCLHTMLFYLIGYLLTLDFDRNLKLTVENVPEQTDKGLEKSQSTVL